MGGGGGGGGGGVEGDWWVGECERAREEKESEGREGGGREREVERLSGRVGKRGRISKEHSYA